jgi:hypothetical protein
MISLLYFLQIMRFNLDPFIFSSPVMISLINLFLRGKTASLGYMDMNQRLRFMQLVRQINGIVRDGADADDIICPKPIRISSAAIIVLPAWFETHFFGKELLCAQSFNPGPIKPISTKSRDIDQRIALCLADHIRWVVIAEIFVFPCGESQRLAR